MLGYLLRRLISVIPVLLLVSLMSFAIIWIVPGDPAAVFLDASATPEQIERLRRDLGLDRPPLMQMLEWYGRVFTGDLGQSHMLRRREPEPIRERLPAAGSEEGQ